VTIQWFFFGIVEPLVIVLIAWIGASWHLRRLRREDERSDAGDVFDQPRSSMSVADRVAELEQTLAALIAGASGWPIGLIDVGVKRLETGIEVLQMTDEELREMSEEYQELAPHSVGPTSAAIMIELARRSTLTGHQRMAEAAERGRMREC
jgi:hypothetical protein